MREGRLHAGALLLSLLQLRLLLLRREADAGEGATHAQAEAAGGDGPAAAAAAAAATAAAAAPPPPSPAAPAAAGRPAGAVLRESQRERELPQLAGRQVQSEGRGLEPQLRGQAQRHDPRAHQHLPGGHALLHRRRSLHPPQARGLGRDRRELLLLHEPVDDRLRRHGARQLSELQHDGAAQRDRLVLLVLHHERHGADGHVLQHPARRDRAPALAPAAATAAPAAAPAPAAPAPPPVGGEAGAKAAPGGRALGRAVRHQQLVTISRQQSPPPAHDELPAAQPRRGVALHERAARRHLRPRQRDQHTQGLVQPGGRDARLQAQHPQAHLRAAAAATWQRSAAEGRRGTRAALSAAHAAYASPAPGRRVRGGHCRLHTARTRRGHRRGQHSHVKMMMMMMMMMMVPRRPTFSTRSDDTYARLD